MQREPEHWTLDKKVPLAIIVALFAQFVGFVYFTAQLENRVSQLEVSIDLARGDRDRLTRVEEKLDGIKGVMQRIESYLDRRAPQPP